MADEVNNAVGVDIVPKFTIDPKKDLEKFVENITPDITLSQKDRDNLLAFASLGTSELVQEEDFKQYNKWIDDFTPDITLGEKDQALLAGGISAYTGIPIPAGLFGGSTAGVQGQDYVDRKSAVQSGVMPTNNFEAAKPINKNLIIAGIIGLIGIFFLMPKKKKRKK